MANGDNLGTIDQRVDLRLLRASHDVRAVLPTLAKRSRNWSSKTICPNCKGPKSAGADQCGSCRSRRVAVAKAHDRVDFEFAPVENHHSANWRNRGAGRLVDQPKRPRMIKMPDGSWATEE